MKTFFFLFTLISSIHVNAIPAKAGRPTKPETLKPARKPITDPKTKKPVKEAPVNENPSLDEYLKMGGFELTPNGNGPATSYVTPTQTKQFVDLLERYPDITAILEVGFNAGHSAEVFLENSPKLTQLISIDLNAHPYTARGIDYLSNKYKDRFTFIEGDSTDVLLKIAKEYPDMKFDLIYLDGGTAYDTCLDSIIEAQVLAHSGTLLLINNVDVSPVMKAAQEAQKTKIITIKRGNPTQDGFGSRNWIEARYRLR